MKFQINCQSLFEQRGAIGTILRKVKVRVSVEYETAKINLFE